MSEHQIIDDQLCPLPSRSKDSTVLASTRLQRQSCRRVLYRLSHAVLCLLRSLCAVRCQPFAFTPLLPCINSTG